MMTTTTTPVDIPAELSCPIPFLEHNQILLAHGGGGRLTHQLIRSIFAPAFNNEFLSRLHDGALFSINGARLAFSTDSYVINPLFFPGGTIGDLAVNGTVNDLAMCGARPLYLSAAFILEEGLAMDDLHRIVQSMRTAAQRSGVLLVTGDTKVVDRGKGDKVFITTSGVGIVDQGIDIRPDRAAPEDVVIVSGPIALHGIAVLSLREGLEFQTEIRSDTAPLNGLVDSMLKTCKDIHVLRDPTRGGVASALNEIAESAAVGIDLDESSLPVPEEVRGACEILGLDPLYVANEGNLLAVVPKENAEAVLAAMKGHPDGADSVVIGRVTADHPGMVILRSTIGGVRVVDMLSGEQLPRIC